MYVVVLGNHHIHQFVPFFITSFNQIVSEGETKINGIRPDMLESLVFFFCASHVFESPFHPTVHILHIPVIER